MSIEEIKDELSGFELLGDNKDFVYYCNIKSEFNACRHQKGWVYEFSKKDGSKETQRFLMTKDNVIETIRKYHINVGTVIA
jgi:hypothetical protein